MEVLYDSFKYILDDDEEEIRFETADVCKSIVVIHDDGDNLVRINEGDTITFTTENDEVKENAKVIKFAGGKKNKKIQIRPFGCENEEIWCLEDIKEGSIKVLDLKDLDEDKEEQNDVDEE